MKKIALTLLLGALTLTSYAQDKTLKIGAKGGLNISDAINGSDTSTLTGFHFGGVTEIFLGSKFSIQPEILYSAQGSKNKLSQIKGQEDLKDVKANFDYINIPVMAKIYILDGLNLQVGPQVGFNVKSKIGGEDFKSLTNTVDFSANVGAGYETPFGLFFDARYNIGLNKVMKSAADNDPITKDLVDMKNGVFQFSVGFKF